MAQGRGTAVYTQGVKSHPLLSNFHASKHNIYSWDRKHSDANFDELRCFCFCKVLSSFPLHSKCLFITLKGLFTCYLIWRFGETAVSQAPHYVLCRNSELINGGSATQLVQRKIQEFAQNKKTKQTWTNQSPIKIWVFVLSLERENFQWKNP